MLSSRLRDGDFESTSKYTTLSGGDMADSLGVPGSLSKSSRMGPVDNNLVFDRMCTWLQIQKPRV